MKKVFCTLSVATLCCLWVSTASAATVVTENETMGGESISCTWTCPSSGAVGFVYAQHGYTRAKSRLDDWAGHMADGNWDPNRANRQDGRARLRSRRG
jgi:hypothetical protein